MTPLEFGPDFSNYGGSLTPVIVRKWKTGSPPMRFAVAGTQNKSITRQQLQVLVDAGAVELEAYSPIYPGANWGTMKDQTERGLDVISGFPIKRWYPDFETWDPKYYGIWPQPVEAVVGLIHQTVDAAGKFPVGIYTGRPWWTVVAGNSNDFAHLPLMHADYGPNARPYTFANPPDLDAWVPYGGFRLRYWQFGNTQDLDGFQVDLNARKADVMISKNVVGTWWDDRYIIQSPAAAPDERYEMDADADLGLTALGTPQRIRLGVYKSAGMGYLRFFNRSGDEAEPVGWGGMPANFGTVDVEPDASGKIAFRVEDGDVRTGVVRLIGYWP